MSCGTLAGRNRVLPAARNVPHWRSGKPCGSTYGVPQFLAQTKRDELGQRFTVLLTESFVDNDGVAFKVLEETWIRDFAALGISRVSSFQLAGQLAHPTRTSESGVTIKSSGSTP